MRRRSAIAIVALLAVACGEDPEATAPVETTTPTTTVETTTTSAPPSTTAADATRDGFDEAAWIAATQPSVDWGRLIAAFSWRDGVVGVVDSDPDDDGSSVGIERYADPLIDGIEFDMGASGSGCRSHHWRIANGADGGTGIVVLHDATIEVAFRTGLEPEWRDLDDGRRVGFVGVDAGDAVPTPSFTLDGAPAPCDQTGI